MKKTNIHIKEEAQIKKSFNKILLIMLVFSIVQIQAQTIDKILIKVQNKVSNNDFKVDLKYQLFKGAGKKAIETFQGKYIKRGRKYYNKIKNTETILGTNFLTKINHDQKAILFEDFQRETKKSNNMLDIKTLLKNFENLKVTDKGNLWKCEMIAKEFTQMPYSKIEMYVYKKDYSIKRQVLYITNLMNFSETEGEDEYNIPRLEINYSNYTKVSKSDEMLFDKLNYVTVLNKKIVPSNRLKGYEIIKY